MVKKLIIGAIAGAIFGVIAMFLFNYGITSVITNLILGALIGYVQSKEQKINIWILGALAGAVFGALLFFTSGTHLEDMTLVLDDIVTGAIIGVAITAIIHFFGDKIGQMVRK